MDYYIYKFVKPNCCHATYFAGLKPFKTACICNVFIHSWHSLPLSKHITFCHYWRAPRINGSSFFLFSFRITLSCFRPVLLFTFLPQWVEGSPPPPPLLPPPPWYPPPLQQRRGSYVWLGETVLALAEWRSTTRASGGRCVMTSGTCRMPRWCADSWAVAAPSLLLHVPASARAAGTSGWTMSGVRGQSPPWQSAAIRASDHTTVDTMKMTGSSVRVSVKSSIHIIPMNPKLPASSEFKHIQDRMYSIMFFFLLNKLKYLDYYI